MLVLTRKVGESINIGDNIKLSIMEIKGRSVRVGIDAPKTMAIYREEIYTQIQEENKRASSLQNVNMESLGNLFRDAGEKKE